MYQNLYNLCNSGGCGSSDNTKFIPLKLSRNAPPYLRRDVLISGSPFGPKNFNYYNYPSKYDVESDRDIGIMIKDKEGGSCSSGSCSLSKGGGSCNNKKLLPVLDPRFNLREVTKQMILLEDHLCHEGKRCNDCITKHFLTIEGFLDEAVTLDNDRKYLKLILDITNKFKDIERDYFSNRNNLNNDYCCEISQRLRSVRKIVMNNPEICSFGC